MTHQLVHTLSGDPPVEADGDRWRRRPVLAAAVRTVVIGVPVVASVGAGVLAGRSFRPHDTTSLAVWLTWTVGASLGVLWLVDRAARRLLPLHRLLLLCLMFPDRAPSRMRVAVRAARRQRPEAVLARSQEDTAADAAARVVTLLGALAVHDRRTRGHSERVCAYATLLGQRLRLSDRDLNGLMWAALIHDIGKLDVPGRLLNKPGRPTVTEWHALQAHPVRGAQIAAPLANWLGTWFDAIAQHHERHDGAGYPAGLRGSELCLGARIISVADACEVMTAARPYRRAVDRNAARAELARNAGSQFDPDIVREFLAISLPDLRRAMGLASLLAQVPLLRAWPRLQAQLAGASSQTAGAAGLATASAVLTIAGSTALPSAIADAPPAAGTVPAGALDASTGGAATVAAGTIARQLIMGDNRRHAAFGEPGSQPPGSPLRAHNGQSSSEHVQGAVVTTSSSRRSQAASTSTSTSSTSMPPLAQPQSGGRAESASSQPDSPDDPSAHAGRHRHRRPPRHGHSRPAPAHPARDKHGREAD